VDYFLYSESINIVATPRLFEPPDVALMPAAQDLVDQLLTCADAARAPSADRPHTTVRAAARC
jgi:hypothetical protein